MPQCALIWADAELAMQRVAVLSWSLKKASGVVTMSGLLAPHAYRMLTKLPETKKANRDDWPKLLNLLVGPHGLEPWTKGL
jgi:hypothetical protein